MDSQILNVYVRGTCMHMCPEKERCLREREKLLHPREILDGTESLPKPLADPKKTVKTFSRSAAGRKASSSSELRPLPVLEKTVSYLFSNLDFDRSEDWSSEYDFIFDRIRAVNQDAVIQGVDGWDCISLFESISRFLVYSGYRLCCEPRYKYDPVINSKYLQECLKKILRLYDEQSMINQGKICYNPEFEALYLISNLGDYEAIHRGIEKKTYLRTRDFEIALAVSLAFWHGNYVRVFKLLKELPLLLSCAASLHVPAIRRRALKIMSISYSSKNLRFPIKDLQSILNYSSEEYILEDCTHYKVCNTQGGVQFLKGSFDGTVELITPRPSVCLDQKLSSINIPGMLLTGKEDYKTVKVTSNTGD
ncbi:SAC3 domain-containing protein 1 isoform X1 [Hetaerina americana]|uniref:SAC3 domain-containing protein 1 isoform X1 n=1 Tax=Hetaerina americana TaxID=62018 RepID=UPI003A7F45D3